MKTLKIALGLGLLLGVCGCNKLQEYNISTHNEVAVVLAIDGDTMQVYKTKNGVDDREILEKDRIITINLTSRVKYFTTDVMHDSQYSVSNNTISDSEKVGRISLSDISVGDPIRIEYYNTEPLQLAKITKKEVRIEELVYKSSNASDPTFTLS
ncbi:MAG: hypothetical protein PHW67_04650, partial [Bacilli bacterium]|nr:hypothetical protein [Bacilli bacterium]